MGRKARPAMWVAIGIFLACSSADASDERDAAAVKAAQTWLAIVDAGRYAESWQTAAAFFKNALAQDQLSQSLDAVRRPLGKVLSRRLLSKTFMTEVPGAPDGQYVVIQFDTAFENKASSVETVTPMMDPDGAWRAAGYFIN